MKWQHRVTVLAAMIPIVAACSSTPTAAPSMPPENGGVSVTEALESLGFAGWVRGFIVARDGEPVRLCESLTESVPAECAGTSLILGDGVMFRSPSGETWVLASVIDGKVTDGLHELERDPLPCGFEPDGPCAFFPGVSTTRGVWWTAFEYSAVGTVEDQSLVYNGEPWDGSWER